VCVCEIEKERENNSNSNSIALNSTSSPDIGGILVDIEIFQPFFKGIYKSIF
jgi:hypothetical protein